MLQSAIWVLLVALVGMQTEAHISQVYISLTDQILPEAPFSKSLI